MRSFKRVRSLAPILAVVLACGAATLVASCYPGDSLTVSEADVVVTTFDNAVDFADLTNYALVDSVYHLVGDGKDEISRAYDAQMLAQVRSNMDGLGFTEVADTNAADVILVMAVTTTEYRGYYSYGCYYYCGWYYPPYWGSYTYTIGTILINMARRDPGASRVPVAWLAALNGYSDKNSNGQRIKSGINQAFAQSKYLGAGK
jgi:hypothetical protein